MLLDQIAEERLKGFLTILRGKGSPLELNGLVLRLGHIRSIPLNLPSSVAGRLQFE